MTATSARPSMSRCATEQSWRSISTGRRRTAWSPPRSCPSSGCTRPTTAASIAAAKPAETYPGFALRLAPYGYNVAVVDFRGVYASYGKNIAYNRGEWVDAARLDAYDVTEWFAKQPWTNGKIGMWGCSATGGSQMQALTTRPPSLKAVVPMSAEFDAYSVHHDGRRLRAWAYCASRTVRREQRCRWRATDRRRRSTDPMAAASLAAAVASHGDNIESVGVVPFKDSVSRRPA